MTGASHSIEAKVQQLREAEIEASKQQRWIMVAANASGMYCYSAHTGSPDSTPANALGLFSPAIVLAGFALINYYWAGKALMAETAFTTVAILTMVTHPANMVSA